MDSTELFTGETSATNPKAPSMKQKIEQQRKNLPIAAVERRLVEEVRNNDTLIIVGETGSGKTTHSGRLEIDSRGKDIAGLDFARCEIQVCLITKVVEFVRDLVPKTTR
ncbi:pre-mRNA-splicing factor ATP-dependent RNA helicase DEAH10 [Nicotiana tabacum]|uniref:Pre-mRNA-splicing factor ATP-dependent RNA helicase DEAH10 n=2 Tax=Nicotiana tabacum TaxID=4097 RepID=A0AC58TZM4_TOBAC